MLEQKTSYEIGQSIKTNLLDKTNLTLIEQGSTIGGIVEAFAQTIFDERIEFNEALDGMSLSTATGEALDALANEYNLERKASTNAFSENLTVRTKDNGTFGENSITTIPLNTTITGFNSLGEAVSFYTNTENTLPDPDREIVISAVAVESGVDNNINAGGLNVINYEPNLLYVHNSESIFNGSSVESDESLRYRVGIQKTSLAKANFLSIRNAARNVPGVSDVVIDSDIITTVYVKSSELYPRASLISDVQFAISEVAASGREIVARLPEYLSIDLTVRASDVSVETDTAATFLSSIAEDYINNLDIGESLSLATLHSVMLSSGSSIIDVVSGSSLFTEATSTAAYGYDKVKTLKTINYALPFEKFTFNSLEVE